MKVFSAYGALEFMLQNEKKIDLIQLIATKSFLNPTTEQKPYDKFKLINHDISKSSLIQAEEFKPLISTGHKKHIPD